MSGFFVFQTEMSGNLVFLTILRYDDTIVENVEKSGEIGIKTMSNG